jgi:3-hydroxymyristoyl/3-hydroxydecanoyl-(acyl carrier protein) dehydratase
MIYEGKTYFGFFSKEALARQVGLRDASESIYKPTTYEMNGAVSYKFEDAAPLSPLDPELDPASTMAMPSKALRMIDQIDVYLPDGGPAGLGFIKGSKKVNPDEWFFKAHFYQDPVWPGSLGIESFMQLIKFAAKERWNHLVDSHMFVHLTEVSHDWIYRGQVIPENKKVEIEAVITRIEEDPVPLIMADGLLKVDGLYIYEMKNFGFKLYEI